MTEIWVDLTLLLRPWSSGASSWITISRASDERLERDDAHYHTYLTVDNLWIARIHYSSLMCGDCAMHISVPQNIPKVETLRDKVLMKSSDCNRAKTPYRTRTEEQRDDKYSLKVTNAARASQSAVNDPSLHQPHSWCAKGSNDCSWRASKVMICEKNVKESGNRSRSSFWTHCTRWSGWRTVLDAKSWLRERRTWYSNCVCPRQD